MKKKIIRGRKAWGFHFREMQLYLIQSTESWSSVLLLGHERKASNNHKTFCFILLLLIVWNIDAMKLCTFKPIILIQHSWFIFAIHVNDIIDLHNIFSLLGNVVRDVSVCSNAVVSKILVFASPTKIGVKKTIYLKYYINLECLK